jgi:hypothetical protein
MKASVLEVASSHVPMLSKPEFVIDVIRTPATYERRQAHVLQHIDLADPQSSGRLR